MNTQVTSKYAVRLKIIQIKFKTVILFMTFNEFLLHMEFHLSSLTCAFLATFYLIK